MNEEGVSSADQLRGKAVAYLTALLAAAASFVSAFGAYQLTGYRLSQVEARVERMDTTGSMPLQLIKKDIDGMSFELRRLTRQIEASPPRTNREEDP